MYRLEAPARPDTGLTRGYFNRWILLTGLQTSKTRYQGMLAQHAKISEGC